MSKDFEVKPVTISSDILDIDKCYLNINPELEKMIREIHAVLVKNEPYEDTGAL